MNYLLVQLFLFLLNQSGTCGEITNQMEIHCKDSFRLTLHHSIYVVWQKNQGGDKWNNVTISGRITETDLRIMSRAADNGRQFLTIDSVLTIANVTNSDSGMYRCLYKKGRVKVNNQTDVVDTDQQFFVDIMGVPVSLESRQLTINEGGNLSISITPSNFPYDANMTWRTPNGTERRSLELTVQNLQKPEDNGNYTFSYTICDNIVFSEFFYVTVNTSQTATTVATTTLPPTMKSSTARVTGSPSATAAGRDSQKVGLTSTITMTKDISIASCNPVVALTHPPPTPTLPTTSPRTTLKDVPIDLDDPSTFTRTKMVSSGIKTSTWVGIIVGAILGTMILCALIVLIVLVRNGNLRHCCRKQTSERDDSPNVLVGASQESTIDTGMYCDVPDEFGDPDKEGASYFVLEETASPVKGSGKTAAPKVSQKPGTSYSVAAKVGYDTSKLGGSTKSTSGVNLEETVQKKGDDTDTTYSGLTTDTDDYDRLRLNKTDSSKMTDPETTYSRVDTKPKDGDYDALALSGVRSAPRVTIGGGSRSHVVDTGDASSATREVPPEYDHLAIGGTQASAREPTRDDSHAYGSLATSEM